MSALDPDAPVERYLIDSWSGDRGFFAEDVASIGQTPDGYMWFGTHRGLIRYDGINFKTVYSGNVPSPLDSWIATIKTDRAGALWLGSRGGLTRYANGRFKTYNHLEGLSGYMVISLLEDSFGNLWIGTGRHHLKCLSNDKLTSYGKEHGLDAWYIKDLAEDRNGVLWVAGHRSGLYQGINGQFKKFELEVLSKDSNYSVGSVMEDRKGVLWVGTTSGLVAISDALSEEKRNLRLFNFLDGLSPGGITSMLEDNEDNIWVATSFGLNRIKRAADDRYIIDRVLLNTPISVLFEDREGSLWVGTPILGLKRVRDGALTTLSHDEGVPLYHSRLLHSQNGDIWLGALNGYLYKYDPQNNNFHAIRRVNDAAVYITALGEDSDGNLWIGSQTKGVFRFKDDRFTHYTVGDPGRVIRHVYTVMCDSKKRMWFATRGDGLWCFQDGNMRAYLTGDGLVSDSIYNIYEDRHQNLWVATHSGLNMIEKGELKKENIRVYLQDYSISAIYEDKNGGFWIGTHNSGLARFKAGSKKPVFYRPEDGLATASIIQIAEDESGNFWFSTPNGIFKIPRIQLEQYKRGQSEKLTCTSFGISDGMKSLFCTFSPNNSIIQGPDGELWFATKKGVSRIQPQKVRINKTPPMVVIEEVLVDGEAVSILTPGTPRVYKGAKNIRFRFTANTFIAQEKVEMFYRLEGRDRHWHTIHPFEERSAYYENLAPGNYRFQVTAANSNGIRNPKGAIFTFTLKPYFYQTLLFKILLGIFLIGLGILANWGVKRFFYIKRLKKKYSNSTLDPEKAEISLKKLHYLMDIKKVYRDESLTVTALAKKLSIAPRYLSQVINEQLNKNFSEFVNGYRIEEAKKVLINPDKAGYSIIEVAYEVGFNTKEVFNRAFKKHTGMTPTQYKKSKK